MVRHVSKVTNREKMLQQTIDQLTEQNRRLLTNSQLSIYDQENQLSKC